MTASRALLHTRRARALRLVAAWSLATCVCGAAQLTQAAGTPAAEIRIGIVDGLSDDSSGSRRRGAELAVRAANLRGGVGGVPVALRAAEIADTWSNAADRARELVYSDGCVGRGSRSR